MVRNGIDRIGEYPHLFSGKRIALATGASGLDANLRSDADCFLAQYGLALLLSPEHGVRGELQPGEKADDFVDRRTGLRCVSLFSGGFGGEGGLAAARTALRGADTVVFDLQDAGSRYFTFASTLFYLMQACGDTGRTLVVLDRPNPIGGICLEGNTHRPENYSFIGRTSVPIRHGMTMGELARFFHTRYIPGCDPVIVPMEGWTRDMWYDDTGLPFTPPSPNLPTLDSLALYNGACLLAGTNVSEGRGTTEPFTLIGAPFVDGCRLAEHMNGLGLPGLRFAEAWFTPQFSKYAGTPCCGVRIHVENRRAVEPVKTGVYLISALRELCPEFAFRVPENGARWHIDIASGTDELRLGVAPGEICRRWQAEADAFRATLEQVALY